MTAMLLALIAIVWLIVRAVGLSRDGERRDAALEELRVRNARSEISGEEFDERRRTLLEDAGGRPR